MAEKYTLFLDAPPMNKLINFFRNNRKENSSFVIERIMKYLSLPTHFGFYYSNFPNEPVYRLEEMNSKMKSRVRNIDFIATTVLPSNMQDLCQFAEKNLVKVNLTSKLMENSLDAKIYKKERGFELSLNDS